LRRIVNDDDDDDDDDNGLNLFDFGEEMKLLRWKLVAAMSY
jgi:hypothetical protein